MSEKPVIEIVLAAPGPDRTVAVERLQPVLVKLEDISTTGYAWSASQDPPPKVEVHDRGVVPSGAPGASGQRTFELLPREHGTCTMRFLLRRPWLPDAPPEREAVLHLQIR